MINNEISVIHNRIKQIFLDYTSPDTGVWPCAIWDFENNNFTLDGYNKHKLTDTIEISTTSEKTVIDSDGVLKWAPHNIILNSSSPTTQSISVTAGVDYTIEMLGSGTVELSDAATGSITEGSPSTITAATTNLTLTVSGEVSKLWAYRSDLGGMQNNPDTGNSYVPTGSTPIFLPGRDYYNNSPGVPWIIEERTNITQNSNNFLNWLVIGTPIISSGVSVGPDSNMSTWSISDDDTTATEAIYEDYIVTDDNNTYVTSLFVEKTSGGTSSTFGMDLDLTGGTTPISMKYRFNTDTGESVYGDVFKIVSVGNFWHIQATITNNTTGNINLQIKIIPAASTNAATVDDNAATGTAIIFGSQTEIGEDASPYIPTNQSSVTRTSDTLIAQTFNISSWNNNQGTIVLNCEIITKRSNNPLYYIDDGTSSNRLSLLWNTTIDGPQFQVWDNGNVVAAIGNQAPQKFKCVVTWNTNYFSISTNGSSVVFDDVGSVPIVNMIKFGLASGLIANPGLKIYSMSIYPKALSNSEIVKMSV